MPRKAWPTQNKVLGEGVLFIFVYVFKTEEGGKVEDREEERERGREIERGHEIG